MTWKQLHRIKPSIPSFLSLKPPVYLQGLTDDDEAQYSRRQKDRLIPQRNIRSRTRIVNVVLCLTKPLAQAIYMYCLGKLRSFIYLWHCRDYYPLNMLILNSKEHSYSGLKNREGLARLEKHRLESNFKCLRTIHSKMPRPLVRHCTNLIVEI